MHPEHQEWHCQAPSPATTLSVSTSSQHRFEVSASICALSCFILCVLGKIYFKGVASLLYTIFTYKRFHRKPQLSDSGRNMYLKLSFNLLFFTLFVLFSQIDFKFLNDRRLYFNFSTISYLFI